MKSGCELLGASAVYTDGCVSGSTSGMRYLDSGGMKIGCERLHSSGERNLETLYVIKESVRP